MNNVFLTSDTHFGHTNVIRYCNRPFKTIEEMNEALIARWNSRVSVCSTVYHLGDFAMGPRQDLQPFRKALNGKIILIKGNHDRSKLAMLEAGFDEVRNELYVEEKGIKAYLRHHPSERMDAPWKTKADVHFCGHVHNEWQFKERIVNVGVDYWQFMPRTISEILSSYPFEDAPWMI